MTQDQDRRSISIFYSYSHRDERLRDELAKHFSVLERCGVIGQWHDRKILPGDEWDRQISEYLETADIILLLVSVDFLASRYCFDVETARALKRHDDGDARVIPVILRPAAWQVTPLGHLQVLPKDALPVTRWQDQDEAFLSICEGILAVAVAWRSATAAAAPPDSSLPVRADRRRPVLRSRILDGALPTRVPVGKATVLVAMIRRTESSGLRGILDVDTSFGVDKEDVRSTESFPIKFPVDAFGKVTAAEVVLTIDSPDFEPATQSKRITIKPTGDSDPRVFLLTARRQGDLKVHLELLQDAASISDCLLKTSAVVADEVISKSHSVVSLPLDLADASVAAPSPLRIEEPASRPAAPGRNAQDDDARTSRRWRRPWGYSVGAASILTAVFGIFLWFGTGFLAPTPAPPEPGPPASACRSWEDILADGNSALLSLEATQGRYPVEARRLYVDALFLAHSQHSLDGVLQSTEALARIGAHDEAAHGLSMAVELADSDPKALAKVRAVADRLKVEADRVDKRSPELGDKGSRAR